ncbi:MBL fold metallo-hydrolase [Chryseobacterium shandongense]|uniref:MBL fold metallo-hydrolase n=1 Tax=Chryseobacterium shandongense TaxID=1493872 RepID=A0AAD1DP31_9FLAO|nr:MBL fold metallo-hydrolase [Chryseobacterium shandongense]AZA88144.1 MBL fold metallo-hydrolase [Chryseobacterium shandongense]AZA96705.1 MBL fold metallo-hydrolase [Chryseobacterium shandongense]
MKINALEIDFLAVGSNSKSGDAIAIRFGNCTNNRWNEQTIFVVDGGDKSAGEAMINHVQNIYKSDKIDRVILTHPDGDHASGLRTVVENMKIGKIWMHCPWNHWKELKPFCTDGRITTNSFGERLRRAYDYADQIENIAQEKGIEIFAPHQGAYFHQGDNVSLVKVLGPGKEFYLSLIQESDKTPRMLNESVSKTFSLDKVTKYETMDINTENLSDVSESTSSENNMSLILYITIAGKKILLTGDSGCDALYKAIYYAKNNNIDLRDLNLLQIPHHGSRHNLSQNILSQLYAPIGIISCAVNGEPNHPSPIVVNALIRRGINPYTTKGNGILYHVNTPQRSGWGSIEPSTFNPFVKV